MDKKFCEFENGVLAPIRDGIDEMKKAVTFLSQQYDDLIKTVQDLQYKNSSLLTENASLKSQVASLNGKNIEHQIALDEAEQYTRRECLEFRGIPVLKDEDTNVIVANIGSLLDVELDRADISISHRLKVKKSTTKTNPPPIIAKFVRREDRDALYKARKMLRNYSTKDLDRDFGRISENKIYISESLTRKNKELFNSALKFKKDHKFKFIWSFYGRIFLRKDENCPPILISSTKNLQDIKRKNGRLLDSSTS